MLDHALINKLEDIAGPDNVLTDERSRDSAAFDATLYRGSPDVVVMPGGAEEAARVLKLAYEDSIPVTPRGGGTGLSGGAVPAAGGIVLAAGKMKSGPLVHKEDLYAEVAPGVIAGDFQKKVESDGLFYPPDPVSMASCTIGGNIAECAAGPRAFKYGTTRHYVLGLELVTPRGEVLSIGARTVKSVAGYDLTRLMVGSEGTLGFITSAMLRLLPLPQARSLLTAQFEDLAAASEAAGSLMNEGIFPSALEMMDGNCVRYVSDHLKENRGKDAWLFVELDGMESVVSDSTDLAARLLRTEFKVDVRVEVDIGARESLWKARRAALPALIGRRPATLVEDLTVPAGKLPVMAREIAKAAGKRNLQTAVFGHGGSGNLHPAFLVDPKDDEEMSRMRSAVSHIRQVCVELEGTVSPGHNVGFDEEPYLMLDIGQSGYEVLKSIKASLDPRGIMNPGKMFYED